MEQNNGKGCVIFLLSGNLDSTDESPKDGIYHDSKMAFWDNWAERGRPVNMAKVEIDAWQSLTRHRSAPADEDKFLIAQWLVTNDAPDLSLYGIQKLSVLETTPTLYWAGAGSMSPEKWPNVLMVDYIGVLAENQFDWDSLGADIYTLAIGLNLYMISENCGVNKRRPPLLPSLSSSKMAKVKSGSPSNGLTAPWNGIIFANGTAFETVSPNFHLGRFEILKNGTVFNNGTVLETNIRNPAFDSLLY